MVWYAVERVDDAMALTSDRLRPFEWSTWWRFALVMFFVGGGGGGMVNLFTQGTPDPGMSDAPGSLPVSPTTIVAVLAVVVLAMFLFGLLVSAIGAVMEFVFVEAIRSETVSVRAWFREHLWAGLQVFVFRIGIGLLTFGVGLIFGLGALVIVALAAGLAQVDLLVIGVLIGLVVALIGVPLFVLFRLLVGIVGGFTTHFAVPIMLTDETNVVSAWISLGGLVRSQWTQLLVYLGVMLLVGIGIAILEMGLLIVAGIVVAIPFGLLALPIGVLWVGESLGGVAIGALVVIGLLYVLAIVIVGLFVKVPLVTFQRTYALLVLGDLDERFDVFDGDRPALGDESNAT